MAGSSATTTKPSRRERQRQATLVEIKGVARRLLLDEGEAAVTLRAIAREMGMTAPALYRYFGSHEELLAALVVDCYDELIAAMEEARDAQPPDDIAARLLAVSRMFRSWSLAHPKEFGLVFANPITAVLQPTEEPIGDASRRFGMVFGGLFIQLWGRRPFAVPAESELDPRVVSQLAAYDAALSHALPLGGIYVFLQCWTRLYGTVCLEVFGHLSWVLVDAQPIFEDMLRELSGLLGFPEDYHPPTNP